MLFRSTVSIRPVVRGQATGEKVVIASGLKAGEQVITEGADRLKEGSRVSLPGDAPRGGGRRPGASAGAAAGAAPGALGPASAPAAGAPAGQAAPVSPTAPVSPVGQPDKPALGKPGDAQPPSSPIAKPMNTAPSAAPSAPPAATSKGPTPEQRQRMLESVKDNPEALERRKRFLERLDSGDAEAIERWQSMQQRMLQGGGQGGGGRPPQ